MVYLEKEAQVGQLVTECLLEGIQTEVVFGTCVES